MLITVSHVPWLIWGLMACARGFQTVFRGTLEFCRSPIRVIQNTEAHCMGSMEFHLVEDKGFLQTGGGLASFRFFCSFLRLCKWGKGRGWTPRQSLGTTGLFLNEADMLRTDGLDSRSGEVLYYRYLHYSIIHYLWEWKAWHCMTTTLSNYILNLSQTVWRRGGELNPHPHPILKRA